MVESPWIFTIESFTEFVKNDPDAAYNALKTLSREEKQKLLVGIPRFAYREIMDRTLVENLQTGIRDNVPTP